MSDEHDEELTPEQEELAQQFAAELEGVSGVGMQTDEDGKYWMVFGGFSVPLNDEQADEFANAVYQGALAKARRLAEPEPDKKPDLTVKLASWSISLGLAGLVAWGLAKLFASL